MARIGVSSLATGWLLRSLSGEPWKMENCKILRSAPCRMLGCESGQSLGSEPCNDAGL